MEEKGVPGPKRVFGRIWGFMVSASLARSPSQFNFLAVPNLNDVLGSLLMKV